MAVASGDGGVLHTSPESTTRDHNGAAELLLAPVDLVVGRAEGGQGSQGDPVAVSQATHSRDLVSGSTNGNTDVVHETGRAKSNVEVAHETGSVDWPTDTFVLHECDTRF